MMSQARGNRLSKIQWAIMQWIPRVFFVLVLVTAGAVTASADWLITLEGSLIETRGPWTVVGESVTYTDLEGVEHTLELAEVDLEGSAETTALRAGEPYEPAETAPPPPAEDPGEEPKILLYVTALCAPCTAARELLDELGVAYLVRDVDSDRRARREYEKKAGHGGGFPVIDVDGALIFTFNPRVVREKVKRFLEKEAAEGDGGDATAAASPVPPAGRQASPDRGSPTPGRRPR